MTFLLGEFARLQRVDRPPCWRKRRWPSRGAAEAHSRALLKVDRSKDPARINEYLCRHCGHWHVGHRKVYDGETRRD